MNSAVHSQQFSFSWDFPTDAKILAIIWTADPQKINCHHSDPQKAVPWTKPRRLSQCALKSDAWFGLWTCGRKLYINLYIHTLKIRKYVGGVVSQLIAMKFGTLIELTCAIKFAKFSVDRSQGWVLVAFSLLNKPFLTLHIAAAHGVINIYFIYYNIQEKCGKNIIKQ